MLSSLVLTASHGEAVEFVAHWFGEFAGHDLAATVVEVERDAGGEGRVDRVDDVLFGGVFAGLFVHRVRDPAAVDGAVVCERGFESAGVGLEADGRDHVGESVDAVGDEAAGLVDALGHAGGYPFADLVAEDA